MEFLKILLLIPSRGYFAEKFRAVWSVDFEDSMMSASRIFKGRKSDMAFFPAPRTKKLRRP